MTDIYFPFNTCEEPNRKAWIAQPVSAFINMVTCLILIYFFLQAKILIIRLLILSFILFEMFHTFSHITHIDGAIQSNMAFSIIYGIDSKYKNNKTISEYLYNLNIIVNNNN